MEDGYCVKWERHHNALISVFDSLYKHNILVDCTLAAENKFIKAHRIVLMACSPYFEELLSQHSENYPIVWMNMKFTELQALINFCYRGEVRLQQAELPGFLNAARLLHIKGLCDSSESYKKRRQSDVGGGMWGTAKKKYKAGDGLLNQIDIGDESGGDGIENEADYAMEEEDFRHQSIVQTNGDSLIHGQGDDNSDRSDLDTDEESSAGEEKESIVLDDLIKGNSSQLLHRWTCGKCGEAYPTRAIYQKHKKGCTADPSVDHPWRCHKCPNTYKNKKDLVRHLLYCGNETERHICERCGSTYKYERGLKRHKIYCGTDVKPMVCHACGKTYKYKRGLRRHQKQQCGLIESFIDSRLSKVKNDGSNEGTKSPARVISTSKTSTPGSKNDSAFEEDIIEAIKEYSSIKDGNAPDVCQTCGKVYKYKKSFLNHVVNCVANEDQSDKTGDVDDEDDDEETSGGRTKAKTTSVKAEVHAPEDAQQTGSQDIDLQPPLEDEPSMDDKAIEKELNELDQLKKELESEEIAEGKGSEKEESILVEAQNNNTKDQTVLQQTTLDKEPSKS